jgi:hypothetical protein
VLLRHQGKERRKEERQEEEEEEERRRKKKEERNGEKDETAMRERWRGGGREGCGQWKIMFANSEDFSWVVLTP